MVEDTRAHELEHALEVQLPFLRARRADVCVTPLVIGRLSLPTCRAVAQGLLAGREKAAA